MAYKCPDCNTYFHGDFCPKCAKLAADCIEMPELETEEEKKAQEAAEGSAVQEKKAQENGEAMGKGENAENGQTADGQKQKCLKCGAVFSGKFCPECGTQIKKMDKCPVCGAERKGNEKFCSNCGYSYERKSAALAGGAAGIATSLKNTGKKVLAFAKRNKKRLIIATAAIAIILAIVVPVSVVFTSPVHPANVDRINIGDTQDRVLSILGEPYGWKEGNTTFTYYSDNYLKIRKQLDEIANMEDIGSFGDLADAIEKEEQLNQKLETLEYKRTTVTFDEGGLVTQIVYNASIIENESRNKQLESHYMATHEIVARQENKVPYTLKYTDGSICKRVARIIPVESETDTEYPFPYEFDVTDPFSETGEKVTFECTVTKGSVGVSVELDASGTLTVYGSGTVGASDLNGISGNINSVIIGGGITEIAGGTFSQLSQIKSVSIGDSVKSIGSYAFNKCINLSSVTIPDSVKEIGTGAFAGCTGLVKVYLPSDVAKYGTRIFYDCNNLQEIHIGDIVDWLAFLSFGKGEQINTENYSIYINGAIPEEIVVPDVILSIPTNAFRNFSRVTDITISSNVRYMGDNLFHNCSNLTNITYEGTMEQWEKIDKTSEWAGNSTDFTITCTDGVLDKSGNQI